ncbi:MAG: FAD-binding oxidoreductase [Pikeienuella sp.]
MKKFSRRAALLGVGGMAGWGLSGLFRADLPTYAGTDQIAPPTEGLTLNDASELSATPIQKHLRLSENNQSLVDAIRREMANARKDSRPLNIGAARHSMGGQAIPRDGVAITFDNAGIEIDSTNQSYRAHAGARWSDVIAALDPAGWSPKVMQSNNDFGLAATFSVNAHGWPTPFGPMGSTVRSLRMVLPSGEVVTCSPSENADLFNLSMGGYGLIGVIVDMEVEMAKNTRLSPTFDLMNTDEFSDTFRKAVDDPNVTMAYGRLNVEREAFFQKALMVTYRETGDQSDLPLAAGSGWMSHAASRLYRAQLGNETFKSFRWWNETSVGPTLASGEVTRNSLINEPVITLNDRNPHRTDILHEYFVGFDAFDNFVEACRQVIPASYQEFLNVTLRYVAQDNQSVLSYATTPRIAAVMSFSQELTQRAEADMARMTRNLIDRIVDLGGAYYLPYRPHATFDQLISAYPQAAEFAKAKREIDRDLLLRNNLWDQYLSQL